MIALVLTTKQQPDNAQKHNITNPMTNKLVVVKKNTKTHTKETKFKQTGHSLHVRTDHIFFFLSFPLCHQPLVENEVIT